MSNTCTTRQHVTRACAFKSKKRKHLNHAVAEIISGPMPSKPYTSKTMFTMLRVEEIFGGEVATFYCATKKEVDKALKARGFKLERIGDQCVL